MVEEEDEDEEEYRKQRHVDFQRNTVQRLQLRDAALDEGNEYPGPHAPHPQHFFLFGAVPYQGNKYTSPPSTVLAPDLSPGL